MNRSTVDTLTALNHIKVADALFQSIKKDNPNTRGGRLAISCQIKTKHIINTISTYPEFDDVMRSALSAEVRSDPFTFEALKEKIMKLAPNSREAIEGLIDTMLKGESITVVLEAQN